MGNEKAADSAEMWVAVTVAHWAAWWAYATADSSAAKWGCKKVYSMDIPREYLMTEKMVQWMAAN